ncbi:MAG: acetylglutamate kinase [Gammaproteobacteria bacterium]|mgnify:FL=1|nr:MAG: acetylglutamate kinase [Gammaproteobacteria bacterium]
MSVDRKQAQNIASVLSEGLPYIQRFYGKTIVIKYGGAAMSKTSLKEGFARDIALMKLVGMNPVIVHGGGPQIGSELKSAGIKTSFISGFRVTDRKTMKIVRRVLGQEINKEIVGLIKGFGAEAFAMTRYNKNIIRSSKLRLNEGKDLGLVGKVESIQNKEIKKKIDKGVIPVISPLGFNRKGECLNINADLVAGKIASSLKSEKLILLTDVEGIQEKKGKLISKINKKEAKSLLAQTVVEGGMKPKLESCMEAISTGVRSCHIIDGRLPHAVLLEVLTDEGIGTMITSG